MARAPRGRQQLLEAARAELLAGNGTVDVGSVVQRATLTTGALYHHFGSKSRLLAAVYDDFYERLDEAIADGHLPEGDWATRERERLRRMVAFHYADPLAAMLLNRSAPDPLLTELTTVYIRRMGEAAARNIRDGQRLGELAADIDCDTAGAYVMGGIRHGLALLLRATPRPDAGQAADRLWRLVAATLGIGR